MFTTDATGRRDSGPPWTAAGRPAGTRALLSPRHSRARAAAEPEPTVLTLCVLERTEDFPLGRHPFDVGMVFEGQQPRFLFLFDLNHLKITRVVTGWVVSRNDSPVVYFTALQGT